MSALVQRKIRGHAIGIWLLWAVGAALLLSAPMAIADPGVWMLIADPELLALMIAVAIAAARVGLHLWAAQAAATVAKLTKSRAARSIRRS